MDKQNTKRSTEAKEEDPSLENKQENGQGESNVASAAENSAAAAQPKRQDAKGKGESKDTDDEKVVLKQGRRFDQVFEKICEVGRGKFGHHYECRERSTDINWVTRVQKILNPSMRTDVMTEIEALNTLRNHPNILLLHDGFEVGRFILLVFEIMRGGELLERISDENHVLTERDCVVYVRQMCDGLAFIHCNGILHLDLKPPHILCVDPCSKHIKIGDFALCKILKPGAGPLRVKQGTPQFMAPEIVNNEEVNSVTDMWALGVIIYIMLSGKSPFKGKDDADTLSRVVHGQYDFNDPAFQMISNDGMFFIASLLIKPKSRRMNSEHALMHPWLGRHPDDFGCHRLNTRRLREYVAKHRKPGNMLIRNQGMYCTPDNRAGDTPKFDKL